jgi:hypothetical protein
MAKKKVNNEETQGGNGVPPVIKGEIVEKDESDQIRELLDEGYTAKQLVTVFGFNYYTVRRIVKQRVHPEGGEVSTNNQHLPATLKAGSGQEVITPEGILQQYLLCDGKEGELMLKGMMLYRAAQMAVLTDVEIMKGQADAQAKMIKPILDVMMETRKEQDAAADRARGSSVDIATKAARETAETVVNYLEQKKSEKPDIASTPDPIKGFMARAMETMWNQINSKLFGGGQQGGTTQLPPGWSDMRNTSQNQQGGQS